MNNLLILSYVALWILVAALYAAVFFLYRHFGQELLRRDSTAELGGPVLGEEVNMTLMTIDGESYRLGRETPLPHVILFADPKCTYCNEIRPVLKDLASTDDYLRIVLVYSGDIESTRRYAWDISERIIAVSDPAREFAQNWKLKGVPYAVVTDDRGVIREKGIASSSDRLNVLFERARQFNTVGTGV